MPQEHYGQALALVSTRPALEALIMAAIEVAEDSDRDELFFAFPQIAEEWRAYSTGTVVPTPAKPPGAGIWQYFHDRGHIDGPDKQKCPHCNP